MKKSVILGGLTLLLLISCQSVPKAASPPVAVPQSEAPAEAPVPPPPQPVVPDPSSITVGAQGFSPLAQYPANTLSFGLHFGSPDKILSWRVEILDSTRIPVQLVTGNPPALPPTLSWDGRASTGELALEGVYTGRLSVDYGDPKGPVEAESAPFLLDITPPSGTIEVSPEPYEPGDPDIMVNPPQVVFQIHLIQGAAPVVSWRLGVIHPDGRRFMDFISEDHRDNRIVWNGRAQNNASLQTGVAYDLEVQVFDRYGNVGWIRGKLPVAAAPVLPVPPVPVQPAPVTVTLDGRVVAETQIFFPAYSADLGKVEPAQAALNEAALANLAEVLKNVPGSRIKVVGHANKVFWMDKAKGDYEQITTLIPLSTARAEAVRDALVRLGLDPETFSLSGVGAEGAVVPFGDLINNWKNRRVEFVVLP